MTRRTDSFLLPSTIIMAMIVFRSVSMGGIGLRRGLFPGSPSVDAFQQAVVAGITTNARRRPLPKTARFLSSSSNEKNTEKTNTDASSSSPSPFASYENRNNIRDQVLSAISKDGGMKVTVCTVRNMINDMMMQHTLAATPADALGRTVSCALLMANGIQDEQIVQITINGDGPLRGVVAIASGIGEVRGYVGTPMLGGGTTTITDDDDQDSSSSSSSSATMCVDLVEAVGRSGSVQIVKNHPDWPRPYNGITAIRHGDIDRDIGIYLAESEQRSCALAAATSIHPLGLLCKAAGGYLIEQLPGVTPETIQTVERNLAELVKLNGENEPLPTNLLLNGVTPLEICQVILKDLEMDVLQEIKPSLKCECSMERLTRSLRLLPKSDIDDILEKEERVEARCQFCGKVYRMEAQEVRQKIAEQAQNNT